MAQLQLIDGTIITDTATIQQKLSALQVQLSKWPIQEQVTLLLNKPQLSETEKETISSAHDVYFERLKKAQGYQSRDLIVLHPDIPNLDSLLKKFSQIHTHDDDEVRYIVDGSGIFGFVLSDEEQVLLTIEAGEFINVPKDTEHWFVLTEQKRIKALRYFTTTDGWSPNYTQRPILLGGS